MLGVYNIVRVGSIAACLGLCFQGSAAGPCLLLGIFLVRTGVAKKKKRASLVVLSLLRVQGLRYSVKCSGGVE